MKKIYGTTYGMPCSAIENDGVFSTSQNTSLTSRDIKHSKLKVLDTGKNIEIEINIPGLTKDQIEVARGSPWVMGVSKYPGRVEEVIHLVLSKGGDKDE